MTLPRYMSSDATYAFDDIIPLAGIPDSSRTGSIRYDERENTNCSSLPPDQQADFERAVRRARMSANAQRRTSSQQIRAERYTAGNDTISRRTTSQHARRTVDVYADDPQRTPSPPSDDEENILQFFWRKFRRSHAFFKIGVALCTFLISWSLWNGIHTSIDSWHTDPVTYTQAAHKNETVLDDGLHVYLLVHDRSLELVVQDKKDPKHAQVVTGPEIVNVNPRQAMLEIKHGNGHSVIVTIVEPRHADMFVFEVQNRTTWSVDLDHGSWRLVK